MTPFRSAHRIACLTAVCVAVAACGAADDGDAAGTPATPETTPPTTVESTTESTRDPNRAGGIVSIRLEEVEGFFIEGFEVGLRIEDGAGETIASTLWSDMVAEQGDDSIEAFYESTWDVAVPSGPVVLHGSANVGAGPPPETPDITGDLNCTLAIEVAPGETATVEVSFRPDDCLQIVAEA